MTPHLVSQEPDWLWLYKPPGLPVFPPHADPDGPCVLRWLRAHGPDPAQAWPSGFEGGLAHRLDVSTSGVVLAARSPQALTQAREAFRSKRLRKTYRLLSSGQHTGALRIEAPLAHHKRDRRKMVAQRGPRTVHRGKWYPAHTELRHVRGPLWEAVIVTGVMHQIRVHAAEAGLPLDGDRLYGGGPLVHAPDGVRFALHHCRMEGIGACPFVPPPAWWLRPLRGD